ncbi:MAG TPA: prolyl oligopeptidase family serine peptidase [Candidatus Nanopelagicales bacterium]|nr:prolyl oligopeptidase family serine peptidase [Candidatus Nanopelagicales bacterium]
MPTYPDAPRLDLVDDLSGRAVPDPYRYLEDAEDERTVAWSAAQHALLEAERAEWTTTEHWRERVAELVSAGAIGVPVFRGERRFYMKRAGDQQFAVLWTVDPEGTERVLLDPMAIDDTGRTTLDSWQPSKEGHLLAYQLSEGGTEESVLRVLDVETGEVVDGPIDRARYSPVAWLPGAAAYYYVRRLDPSLVPADEAQFHRRVYLHRLGADPSTDVEIFGAGRPITSYFGVQVSMDGRWLQLSSQEGTEPRNDLWLADLTASSLEEPALVDVQVDVDAQTGLYFARDGRLLVHTDRDAPRGRVMLVEPDALAYESWRELVAEDDEAVLEDLAILDGIDEPVLAVAWTRHGVGEISLHDAASGARTGDLPLPGVGTLGGLAERPDGGPVMWFVYTDFTTQVHVYSYDARTGEVSLYATPPGSVDVPDIHSQMVEYPSQDGTVVRMFILSKAAEPDVPRPTILYGYGGFGISMTPGFSAVALAWVEAGGVYAIACLRGGGEEGEDWHRAGMLGDKQNVFDDFHAAAEFLEREGWTTRDQLAINGGSNGGLLVGAAITQRPELYGAAICVAPLLDMVRYVTSELGLSWTVEYGDPAVPEELDWLLGYSPYHNVREGAEYPATMFVVFDNDTRTDPMHGRKLCAAVQHAQAGTKPVLIRTDGDVGHGARKLSKSVEESADMLAFAARWTGLRLN